MRSFILYLAALILLSSFVSAQNTVPSIDELYLPPTGDAGVAPTDGLVPTGEAILPTDTAATTLDIGVPSQSDVAVPNATDGAAGNIVESPVAASPTAEVPPPQGSEIPTPASTPEPTPILSPDESFDLDCIEFVDDFAAFDCMEVSETEVNTTDFDCVDFLDEPNFMCTNIDGAEVDCEELGSSELPSGSGDPLAETPGDNVNTAGEGTAANLQGAGSRAISLMLLRDTAIVGLAMAAGAMFVL